MPPTQACCAPSPHCGASLLRAAHSALRRESVVTHGDGKQPSREGRRSKPEEGVSLVTTAHPRHEHLWLLTVHGLGSRVPIHCLTLKATPFVTEEAAVRPRPGFLVDEYLRETLPCLLPPCSLSELREPSHVGPFHCSLHVWLRKPSTPTLTPTSPAPHLLVSLLSLRQSESSRFRRKQKIVSVLLELNVYTTRALQNIYKKQFLRLEAFSVLLASKLGSRLELSSTKH